MRDLEHEEDERERYELRLATLILENNDLRDQIVALKLELEQLKGDAR